MAPETGDALDTALDTAPDAADPGAIAATDGRVPGRRGLATRSRLLECTAELLATTAWRSIKVIDIARQAGTSPATFYQYFENVEQAILVMAEELMQGAGVLAELVDGDWSEDASWHTARRVVEGFMTYWEVNRAVFRVVELATEEGDLRFQGLRVRALNAVTVTLARVIASGAPWSQPGGLRPHGRGGHAHLDARPRRRPPLRLRVLGHPHHGHGRQPGPGPALGRDRASGPGERHRRTRGRAPHGPGGGRRRRPDPHRPSAPPPRGATAPVAAAPGLTPRRSPRRGRVGGACGALLDGDGVER